jgi:hypothetical protein
MVLNHIVNDDDDNEEEEEEVEKRDNINTKNVFNKYISTFKTFPYNRSEIPQLTSEQT